MVVKHEVFHLMLAAGEEAVNAYRIAIMVAGQHQIAARAAQLGFGQLDAAHSDGIAAGIGGVVGYGV